MKRNGGTVRFTIHFATINTSLHLRIVVRNMAFTIHFATINTFKKLSFINEIFYLQYTLLLLILYL